MSESGYKKMQECLKSYLLGMEQVVEHSKII